MVPCHGSHPWRGGCPPSDRREEACIARRQVPPPPKEAHSRIFVSGGQYSRDKCAAKKIYSFSGLPACIIIISITINIRIDHHVHDAFTIHNG